MKIKSPREYGLPEKFDSWRPGQEEALHLLATDKKVHTDLCAPTGFGKSAVIVADALASGEPSCIVTHSKGLQDQYMRDFASIGMVDIRGRNNYNCQCKPDDPTYTCEEGYVSRCMYKGTVACPSSQAEMRASLSPLVVTNYAKWSGSKLYGNGMSHYKRVYFDEGHNCPSAIAQAMQVVLNTREIEDGLGIDFLHGADSENMFLWKKWAANAKEVADTAMKLAYARITGVNDPKPSWIRQYTHTKNLCRRLAVVALAKPTNWVVDELKGGKGFQFDPIHPGMYSNSTLYFSLPRIITVSATLRPKTMFMCGVGRDQFTFKEFKSDFNPRRSPINYVPTMRVDKWAEDLGPLWSMFDRVMSRRKNLSGVIHTVSYARQGAIREQSRYWERMIVNPQGSPASHTVEDFKNSDPGTVLVSPSVGEGYDFPYDECRWQIVSKIPFEPPSKIVKAREAADKEYRAYQAIQALVQAFGRGMRHDDDWCEGFIFDMHMDWFWPRFKHLAPASFHSILTRTDILPPPLNPDRL